ncbi:MAG: autotransporter domain-containing protein [Treponema sp.]|jgi:hypothetical protein|nr:autotransporter domain-containing protein [Treponema sp.]
MPKKIMLVLGFLLLACGTVSADDADEEITMPKNTITVDAGQTAFLLLYTGISNLLNPDSPTFAIGIAAQYERQIIQKASAAVRFEYGIIDKPGSEMWRISAIVMEGHGRYYPEEGPFFLDGTLGYAYIFTDFSSSDRKIKPTAHYFKFGGKLGWRIDFKKPGGFVFEPALGFYGAVGTGLNLGYDDDVPVLGGLLNFLNTSIARMLFVDGLRVSLCIGYSF